MPKISVIVPIYKAEPYIHRCIDSILNQTFTDFQLILVDDGSPDNCGKICDEYSLNDNRIFVIHQKNSGVSAARNSGIDWVFANSVSDFISFIDIDDWVHPEYLENLYYPFTVDDSIDCTMCSHKMVTEFSPFEAVTTKYFTCNYEDLYCNYRTDSVIVWGKLFRIGDIKDVRFPVGKIHEDLSIVYLIMGKLDKVAFVQDALYFYYQSEGSLTRCEWSENRLDEISAQKELVDFFKNENNVIYVASFRDYVEILRRNIEIILDKHSRNDAISVKYLNELKDALNTAEQESSPNLCVNSK